MTEGDPDESSPSPERALKEEAERYARMAAEEPERPHVDRSRIVELLRMEVSPEAVRDGLERRAAASRALARLAHDDADAVGEYVGSLVDVLRTERDREIRSGATRVRTLSRGIRDDLVRTVSLVIADRPETVAEIDDASEYVRAITTDSDTETLRAAAEALFAGAPELRDPVPAVEALEELTAYPDSAVRAWGAGALGRLAEEHPDAVAPAADDLRGLLDHDDDTVRHNAVEALAALVRERPDAVAPAADDLRDFLDYDDAALQHNAAGVLGRLAGEHADAVVPAVGDLRDLLDHDDDTVRRIATGALARLARERPEAVDRE